MSLCLYCQKKLSGRLDKKFCDSSCRTSYYNDINRRNNNLVRRVNYSLKRNHKILCDLLPEDKEVYICSKKELNTLGINWEYYTQHLETAKGDRYFFVYDKGYRLLEKDKVMVVHKKDN